VTPLAPQRFALQLTIDQSTQEKLKRAQALLRHRLPSGALDQVLDHALDALLAKLERQKFGATTRPRTGQRRSTGSDPRHVPSEVKRAVHARDGEQCTFVSAAGVRCLERGFLEIDHRTPVAHDGEATVENVRILCKPHNAYEAERIFGATFMQSWRSRTRKLKPCTTPAGDAAVPAPAPAVTASVGAIATPEMESDALLGLTNLGFTAAEARSALARSAHLPAPTLEQRLRVALAELHRARAQRCSEAPARWQPGRGRAIAQTTPDGPGGAAPLI
jgi:hypothetical protein